MNRPRMSLTLMADIRTGQWDKEIAEQTGLPARLLPSPCGSAEIVGTVTQWAASMTGLAAGTPVTGGTIDTVAATIGAGAVDEGDFAHRQQRKALQHCGTAYGGSKAAEPVRGL